MTIGKSALALTLLALVATEATAAGFKGSQNARIRRGVATGQLTGGEAARLRADQRQDARRFQRLSQDGLTAGERARLARDRAHDSRQIFRQKHDGQTAGGQTAGGQNMSLGARDARQDGRIERGTQTGALTEREAAFLQQRDARIAALDAKLRENGLTPQERLRLQHQRDVLSRQIYNQAHDNQVAPPVAAPTEPAPAPAQ